MVSNKKITRREFLKKGSLGVSAVAAGSFASTFPFRSSFPAPYIKNNKIANKVIVIGIDGMDPILLQRYMQNGDMPTFQKIANGGHFGKLRTTMPPQTPVAWASFISGTNPGGNGIFDFVHRDPATFTPYLSTSRSFDSKSNFKLGEWTIPLKSGKVELMRRGPAFWSLLEQNDIPAVLFQLPSNFPVPVGKSRVMSGMGTPDLLGTYGTFTYYTDTEVPDSDKFTGGRVVKVIPREHVIKTSLGGPKNSFRSDGSHSEIEFTVYRDAHESVAKINIQEHEIILRQGEWSQWLPLKFELLPMMASVSGMVRMYMKEVHPHFKLYLSPVNIDPVDPTLPICSPDGYAREVAEAIGRFHTQGFPTDSKALTYNVLSDDEYLTHANLVLDESLRAFDYELNRFHEGFFFFYFSSIDQNTHMLWRNMDPTHPLYDPNGSAEVKDALRNMYRSMDNVLRQALSKADSSTTIMAISDHGFVPFTREFHVSTWLVQNGYTVLTHPEKMTEGEFFRYVDWKKTTAYALGLNGIYINLKGREKQGSVNSEDSQRIKNDIIQKLSKVTDPKNGNSIATAVYDGNQIYSGPYVDIGPDIAVGYQSGYRISDEAVLGKFPKDIVGDRTDKWSADHCLDPQIVPGMIVANKRCAAEQPALWDIGPTVLKAFGFDAPKEMEGKPVLEA